MESKILNIRFNNPNTHADTVEFIAKIFIEVSKIKFEKALQKILLNDYRHKAISPDKQ